MSCTLDRDKLTGYFDGELDSAERAEVEKHIHGCSECLRELEEVKSASFAIRSLPRHPVPAQVTRAIREAVDPPMAKVVPIRRFWMTWAASAAAVVFVALNIVFLTSIRRREPAPHPPAERDQAKLENREKSPHGFKSEEKHDSTIKDEERPTSDVRKEESKFGGDLGRHSSTPRGPRPHFYTIVCRDVADARGFVEDELAQMRIGYRHGGSHDASAYALDTCIEVELTERQLAHLETLIKAETTRFVWKPGDEDYRRRRSDELIAQRDRGREPEKKSHREDPKKPESDQNSGETGGGRGASLRIIIYFHELERTTYKK